MFRTSARRIYLAVAVVASAAACTSTPTSPSQARLPAPPRALSSSAPAEIGFTPPNALGAIRFVAFGDSITYGILSSYDGMALYDGSPGSYPARLQLSLNTLHQPQRFTVINRGVPAEAVTTDGVRRIGSVLSTDRPQALLLLEGINDIAGDISVEQTANALQRIVDASLLSGAPVLLATMFQTYPTTRPDGEMRENAAELVPLLNQRIRQIASRQNVYLVDLYAAFGTNHSLVGGDGLHPTEDGYAVMASTFLGAIRRAFPVQGSFQ